MQQGKIVDFKKASFYLIYEGEIAIHKKVLLYDPNNSGVHNSYEKSIFLCKLQHG